MAPALVYQCGQPWDMPGNVDLAPGVNLEDVALPGKKDGQFIYGVKPCVGQRNATTAITICCPSRRRTAAPSPTS